MSSLSVAKNFDLMSVSAEDNVPLKNLIVEVLMEYGCNKEGFAAQDASLQCMSDERGRACDPAIL